MSEALKILFACSLAQSDFCEGCRRLGLRGGCQALGDCSCECDVLAFGGGTGSRKRAPEGWLKSLKKSLQTATSDANPNALHCMPFGGLCDSRPRALRPDSVGL